MMTLEVVTLMTTEVSCARCGNVLVANVQSGNDTAIKAKCWIKAQPCEHCLATAVEEAVSDEVRWSPSKRGTTVSSKIKEQSK